MPWKETAPGRFEHPLAPSDEFFVNLRKVPCPPTRERWALTAVAKFKSDIPQEYLLPSLRQAWKTMRYDLPLIAATLEDSSKVYEVPDAAALETWLDDTIVVEPLDADPDKLIGNYVSTELSKLHYLPGSSQIMIRVSHWRTDGLGLCMIVNHFFEVLSDPRPVVFGDEGARLPRSCEELFGVCDITPEKQKAAKEKWTSAVTAGPFMGLPGPKLAISRGTYRKTFEFSSERTTAIVLECKKRGVSVTSAISAAIACVIKEHGVAPLGATKNSILTMPHISIRRYLPDELNTSENSLTVMTSSEPIIVTGTNFGDLANEYHAHYSRDHSVASGSDLIPTLGAKRELQSEILKPKPPSSPTAARQVSSQTNNQPVTPVLNSLGILDRYIGAIHSKQHHVEISDFWFSTELLGPAIQTYVWTFRGKLRFSTFYNEAMFEQEYIQWFQTKLIKTLLEELHIIEQDSQSQSSANFNREMVAV